LKGACNKGLSRAAIYTRENLNHKEDKKQTETQSRRSEKREKSSGREGAHRNYAMEDKPKSLELGTLATWQLGGSHQQTWQAGYFTYHSYSSLFLVPLPFRTPEII
jgi:hypothetical protein